MKFKASFLHNKKIIYFFKKKMRSFKNHFAEKLFPDYVHDGAKIADLAQVPKIKLPFFC